MSVYYYLVAEDETNKVLLSFFLGSSFETDIVIDDEALRILDEIDDLYERKDIEYTKVKDFTVGDLYALLKLWDLIARFKYDNSPATGGYMASAVKFWGIIFGLYGLGDWEHLNVKIIPDTDRYSDYIQEKWNEGYTIVEIDGGKFEVNRKE